MERQIKIYTKDGVFRQIVNPINIQSDIAFNEELNSGQGDFNLSIKNSFDTTKITEGDIVEVRLFDSENPRGKAIFSGIVERISDLQNSGGNSILLQILGTFTLLNNFTYRNNDTLNQNSFTFTKSGEPAQMIRDIIDFFNTRYSYNGSETLNLNRTNIISYTAESIQDFGTNLNIEFDNDNCKAAIDKIQEATGYNFYVDASGVVNFKAKRTVSNINLTFGNNILEINNTTRKTGLVNRLFLQRGDGTIKIYENIPSQDDINIKEIFLVRNDLQDEASQDAFGNNYINENKDRKRTTYLDIPADTNISVGDSIRTQNTNNQIKNIEVVRININSLRKRIFLQEYISFGRLVTQNTP